MVFAKTEQYKDNTNIQMKQRQLYPTTGSRGLKSLTWETCL